MKKKGKLRRVKLVKSRRANKALLAKQPQIRELLKSALFVKGKNCSQTVLKLMKDFAVLKSPDMLFYGRKNDVQPFNDISVMEHYCRVRNRSLFLFGSSNKKRPDNIVIGRMFDFHLLDMIEFGVKSYTSLKLKKDAHCGSGHKPCLLFVGEPFETQFEYQRLKSLLIDFFRGRVVPCLNLAGLNHVLMFAAVDGVVHMRTYCIHMKKSGTSIPRIELDTMGLSVDLIMRRNRLASDDMYSSAIKTSNRLLKRKSKNISRDQLGTRYGRVHLQKMDLNKLQLRRRLRALKKTPQELLEERLSKRRMKAATRLQNSGIQE